MHYDFLSFEDAVATAEKDMIESGRPVRSHFWQAMDIRARPEAEMRELTYYDFSCPIPLTSEELAKQIKPNMPWAEEHFQERVGGIPVNPGVTWKTWPWSNNADKHRGDTGQFSHNYMERYWPKHAGGWGYPLMGIRFPYGDILDVIALMVKDPNTRQAYMPVFFPEDTGAAHGERIPCSIGYHFMIRDGKLNCTYQLRSCDLYRHFRDDLYLTASLVQWVVEELRLKGVEVIPGDLHVYISSLHLFINDFRALTKKLSA